MEANEAIMQAADTLSMVGALRRVTTLEERVSLVQSAADFFVNGRVSTALQQFVEGLKTLNVLDEIQKNPALFHEWFVCDEKPLWHGTCTHFSKCVFLCKAAIKG
ncbi:hypothetical protein CRENBAI_020759 [Crenichthys baileyi]|uniref:Uncharacterized protein n=1 Tax=Crenichthys baileyi TaxID=28760 RepID=A0AAV9R552_9TELE